MGNRYVKTDQKKKILYIGANNLNGRSMSQPLPYDEIEMWHGQPDLYINNVEEISKTPDDSDIGYYVEVDLRYPANKKEKTKNFPFCPENKIIVKYKYNEYMKEIKPKNYIKFKKLISDWTDKKNYLDHYKMLKLYVRHGMLVDKTHEIKSFNQSRWLEKYINFNTQKGNKAKKDFEKDFYKLLNNAFYGTTMQNARNRLRLEFFKKVDYTETTKKQSKLTFNAIHKSYENCASYVFRKIEVQRDKPIYLGFAVLELSKLHMYETYYDKLQPYFGEKNLHLHYMDTDSFILSVNTNDIIRDLKNLEDILDFSNLDRNNELFSNRNKNVIGKYKIETPKIIWIDEFVCLRNRMYSFE